MAKPTYTRVDWKNFPNSTTPINATNLNNIENGIEINRDNIANNATDIATNAINIATNTEAIQNLENNKASKTATDFQGSEIIIAADQGTIKGSGVELSELVKTSDVNSLITSNETVIALTGEVRDLATGKENVISDLATIRAGAEKGATALQSVPEGYITEDELRSINPLGWSGAAPIAGNILVGVGGTQIAKDSNVSINNIATKQYVDTAVSTRVGITTNSDIPEGEIVVGDATQGVVRSSGIAVSTIQDISEDVATLSQTVSSANQDIDELATEIDELSQNVASRAHVQTQFANPGYLLISGEGATDVVASGITLSTIQDISEDVSGKANVPTEFAHSGYLLISGTGERDVVASEITLSTITNDVQDLLADVSTLSQTVSSADQDIDELSTKVNELSTNGITFEKGHFSVGTSGYDNEFLYAPYGSTLIVENGLDRTLALINEDSYLQLHYVAAPTTDNDAATKQYVDTTVNNKFTTYSEEATCTWNSGYSSVWGNQRMFCTKINNLLFCTLSFEASPQWIAAITAANDALLLCNFWRTSPTSCTIPITGIDKTTHTSRTDYLTLTRGSTAITMGRGNTEELQNTTYYFVNFTLDLSKN